MRRHDLTRFRLDPDARDRRRLVRVVLVVLLLGGSAAAVALLWPWLARSLYPAPTPGKELAERSRKEVDGIAVYLELLAREGDDLAIIVCVETTDPARVPLRGGGQLHVRFWDERGKVMVEEADEDFSFCPNWGIGPEKRVIQPIVVRPPAGARSLIVNWDNTDWQTKGVPIPPRPGTPPRWLSGD